MSIGFTLPFAKSTGSIGYFDMTQDEYSAVRENLKSLLLTNWGERVAHYNFGCNLIEFLFENDGSQEMKSRIADRILLQISTWMPFVTVEDLNIVFSDEDDSVPEHAIAIKIKFRLSNKPDVTKSVDFMVSP
ncbi:MAG: GPW/gp25 family protein [Candidatus Shapirobacteria bacterium]|jgi:phage baseplate assembly protein W